MNEQFYTGMARATLFIVAMAAACISSAGAAMASDPAQAAASLRATYSAQTQQLENSPFQRPLLLESVESKSALKGDIYALIDHPFAAVKAALTSTGNWCDVLILHINTKYCHASDNPGGPTLEVSIGKKDFQRIEDAHRLDLKFRAAASTPDYFDVRLNADQGPLATSDYAIRVQAVPINNRQTFIQLTYSYSYGMAGRFAMQGYLATGGRNKVGFTVTGAKSDGAPEYIGGVRGVVERNTMRYYLAIEAYMNAASAPPAQQMEARLINWYAATERYARQLHELDQAAYLSIKRSEYQRQQTAQR